MEENSNIKNPLASNTSASPLSTPPQTPQMPNLASSMNQVPPGMKTQTGQTQTPSSIASNQQSEIAQNNVNQAVVVAPAKKSSFRVFIIAGLIVVISAWVFAGYQYLQKANDNKGSSVEEDKSEETTAKVIFPEKIVIVNGNVVSQMSTGETKRLVEKKNYPDTGITGFGRVLVSPDKKYMCIESWSPAPEPALYYSSVSGESLIEISKNKKACLWTEDSKNLIYVGQTDSITGTDIYIYNIEEKQETNLTQNQHLTDGLGYFETVGLSADGSKIICTFTTGDEDEETIRNCEIDIESKVVTVEEVAVD